MSKKKKLYKIDKIIAKKRPRLTKEEMLNQIKSEPKAENEKNLQQAIIDKINAEEKAKYDKLLGKTNQKFIKMMDDLNIN